MGKETHKGGQFEIGTEAPRAYSFPLLLRMKQDRKREFISNGTQLEGMVVDGAIKALFKANVV